jgi:predicted nucleotidyltransferase
MLRFKMLFAIIFIFAGVAGANGHYCLSFYNHLLKNQTPISRAQLQSIKSDILNIKQRGENAGALIDLAVILKNLPPRETEDILSFLIKDYGRLTKDRVSRDYAYAPKRSIDFQISQMRNPLKDFENESHPLLSYKNYLNSFQTQETHFVPVKIVFETLLKLNTDLINSSVYGDSKYLIYGSFINGRATEKSDIDIMEYLDTKSKSRYSVTSSYLKLKELNDFEISGTYGNYTHINTDIDFSLKVQPLAIILTIKEIQFIIKNGSETPKIFIVPINELKLFTEKL